MQFGMTFPGQGSQSVGMLGDLAELTSVREVFQESSDAIDTDLYTLATAGPDDTLNQTQFTQPALLAAGVAFYRVWKERGGGTPHAVAGHSLGEYTALCVAGSLSLADAVRLVHKRGVYMQQAVPEGTGAMAAVLGLEDADVVAACDKAAGGDIVSAANFNAPGQVVIAGDAVAVERAIVSLQEYGAKKVVPLAVSVPSHCALMRPAAERLQEDLAELRLSSPGIPVVHNVDARVHDSVPEVAQSLVEQLYQPVRWVDSVTTLKNRGCEALYECGPGKVLTGLMRRIDRRFPATALVDIASIEATIAGRQ